MSCEEKRTGPSDARQYKGSGIPKIGAESGKDTMKSTLRGYSGGNMQHDTTPDVKYGR